jgi:hypothetical protein
MRQGHNPEPSQGAYLMGSRGVFWRSWLGALRGMRERTLFTEVQGFMPDLGRGFLACVSGPRSGRLPAGLEFHLVNFLLS